MDNTRRSFDRSREQPGVKRARMIDEPNLRDPRLLNSSGLRGGVRAEPVGVRYRQIEREEEANDADGGGYHPTHQLFSELVREYKKGLGELTVNSKPIITNLTIIAGENLHAAKSIAEAICSHIIEVPSEQKLPSLYLLDSIVKNIGRDYIKYFSTKLPEVYCKAYKQSDPSIHAGLRHLFRTWEGVFPLQPLKIIEKELGITLAVNGSGSVSARSKPDPQSQYLQKGIHVNPKYLEARQKLQPPSRVKGPTNNISPNAMKSTGNAARLGIQHREPVREASYEKDAEVMFDDCFFSLKKSSVCENDKHWYGNDTDLVEPVLGQQNSYDGKRKLGRYATPQSHVSRTNGGMPSSWKYNDEDEFSWDDINSGVIKYNKPTEMRKDNLGIDHSDAMETDAGTLPVATSLQSIPSTRVLGVTSVGASSSLGRKALQPQIIRNPVSGALARSQTNNNPTIVQKRPPPPSHQPTSHQRPPSPSISSGHAILPVAHSMQTGKKQLIDSQKSKGTSSVLPSQSRMQQHSLPDHSRPERKLSEPNSDALISGTSVAEAVQHLTSSGLFSAVLNSGVLSKGVSILSTDVDDEGMQESLHSDDKPHIHDGSACCQPPEISAASITASSQANKLASVSKRIGAPYQIASRESLSKKEVEEKTAPANPYSNLFSTLMEKGLITSSKYESPTAVLSSNESKGTIPSIVARSMMTTTAPDSTKSSLVSGDNSSALEHAAHKAVDNVSEAPKIKNILGFEFKPSLIRQLHEPVIKDLIDGLPYRCSVCGLRLKLQERLDKHMEWHSSKDLDNEYGASRRWFPDLDDWVAGNSYPAVSPDDSAEEIEAFSEESCLVPADENQCVCILCGELFEDYYSHEEEGWMFRGAMLVKFSGPGYETTITSNNPTQDIIVHAECFSGSPASELGLVAKVKTEEDA